MPITAYHGSNAAITRFDVNAGRATHPDGLGAWFSEDPRTAEDFAADRARTRGGVATVMEVELALANPLIVQTFDALKDLVKRHRSAPKARAWLQEQGYDGIVIDRSYPGLPDLAKDYIVFVADQVRVRRAAAPGQEEPGRPASEESRPGTRKNPFYGAPQ